MIVQEAVPVVGPWGLWKRIAKTAAAAALVCLAVACALVAVNAHSSSSLLVLGAQILSAAALGFGLLSLAAGLGHLTVTRPDTRRPVTFLLLLTLAIFAAHLYIINSPATTTSGDPLSGTVGSTFQDSHISISSSLMDSRLSVNATDIGGNAISSITMSLGNYSLPASGFSGVPSDSNPVQPSTSALSGYRDQVQGTWDVQATASQVLTVTYQYLTCYHTPDANDARGVFGCIMDETYYVPSAQTLLVGTQCSTFTSNCNLEHPFLAKGLIAAGIAIFGLNGFGWRIFIAVMGTLSIPLLFVLAYLISGNRRLAYFASVLLALDILFFVHSSAALIDVPAVFFSLLGFIFYFWRVSYRRVNHLFVSGVFFGLAALSKETALFMVLAILFYELLFGERSVKVRLGRSLLLLMPAVLVFIAGVQAYDTLFTSGSFPYFYQQVSYMLSYGSGLKGGGWTDAALHRYITPLDWLAFYSPVSYLVTSVTVTAGQSSYSYVSVGYYGVANVIIVWMVFAWVPYALYRALRERKWRATPSGDDRFALFLVVWFLWAYLPYVFLWLYGRVTYPFYLVPAIPALAGGAGYFITRDWFSPRLALTYVAFAFLLFFLYFPVKDFLPVFVRAALGR